MLDDRWFPDSASSTIRRDRRNPNALVLEIEAQANEAIEAIEVDEGFSLRDLRW